LQSSIAFTGLARGNVAAAVCAASFSSLAGIVITPALPRAAGWLAVRVDGGAVTALVAQLLVPFAAGQLARRWIADWIAAHKPLLTVVDRGSILLVGLRRVQRGMVAGVWQRFGARLAALIVVCVVGVRRSWRSRLFAARLGFARPERVTLVFCGRREFASGCRWPRCCSRRRS